MSRAAVAAMARKALSLLIFLFISDLIHAQYDNDCKWRSNVTDVDELAHHKYAVLEDCLFYKLSQDADKMQGKGNALMLLPPTVTGGETLDVEIENVFNEVWREMHINGYFSISWKDRRMRWDVSDWKTDTLNIKSYGRLWLPDINSALHQTSVQSTDYTTYQNINAKSTGNVSARLEFRMQAHCEINYADFPDDEKYCCFTLRSTLYPHYIKYFLVRGENGIDLDDVRTNWNIKEATVKQLADEDDRKAQVLEVCLRVRRRSTTLRIELTVPMLISSLLCIIAPFFGRFQQQLYVKLFALLLQFLCFQFLVNKTPQIGFGGTVPKIYVFYAFTLATTVCSLLVTLIVSAASRIHRKIPPAHRYTLLAAVLNTQLCCSGDVESNEKDPNSSDWLQVHVAINNIVSIGLLGVYLVGIVLIAF